ncbi:serine/threonine-protein kinase [Arthrobacter sp. ISL-30]|uniref:serine/threonine-protein kinase n=1 Tax=Arthrobacter sp. ISL-30 TaxID=2819109 RepID=UPI001BE67406|nr:serine/threonine-protein kinase [Arthrobacter sp. ISL-30]MBT2512106.1 serine/threonine protein kinase [Arthrobacter sp. ISL-30]
MENLDSHVRPAIPGFTTIRELGRGASAVVWLANRDIDGGLYAIKCLETAKPGEADVDPATSEDRVRREVRILSAMAHQHLVRIHDVLAFGPDEQHIGLVMDYAPGGSVGEVVASRGRLGVGETVTVLTPIAQCLAYLHHNGLVHGDVSPGNLLFTEHGKPLLTDLGLARMAGDHNAVTDGGTPGFVAPEVFVGPDAVAAADVLRPERDVFALAALGWFCLTGAAPGSTSSRPPLSLLVPDVPANLAAGLEAGLNPDPLQRPTATEFATAVFRSAAAEPLDLSTSVHASVVPALLTRREARAGHRHGWASWIRYPGKKRNPQATLGFPLESPGRRTLAPGGSRTIHAPRYGLGPVTICAVAALLAAGTASAAGWLPLDLPQETSTRAQAAGPQSAEVPEGVVPSQVGARLPEHLLEQVRVEDPLLAAHGLAELRSMAIGATDQALLERVNVPSSPAALSDKETLEELRAAGIVLEGFTTTLEKAVLVSASTDGRAVVEVEAATSAYRERDARGTVVADRSAGPARTVQLVLLRSEGSWKISEVLASGQDATSKDSNTPCNRVRPADETCRLPANS